VGGVAEREEVCVWGGLRVSEEVCVGGGCVSRLHALA